MIKTSEMLIAYLKYCKTRLSNREDLDEWIDIITKYPDFTIKTDGDGLSTEYHNPKWEHELSLSFGFYNDFHVKWKIKQFLK